MSEPEYDVFWNGRTDSPSRGYLGCKPDVPYAPSLALQCRHSRLPDGDRRRLLIRVGQLLRQRRWQVPQLAIVLGISRDSTRSALRSLQAWTGEVQMAAGRGGKRQIWWIDGHS